MRIIDENLSAALAAGTGTPYIIAYVGYENGTVLHSHPAISYKLTGTELEFEVAHTGDLVSDQTHMWIERGLTIAGVNYTVTSGRFRILSQTYHPNGHQIARGSLFPKQYYAAAGDDTYENVITAFCSNFGKTAVFKLPASAWLDYQFFPTGKSLIFNDANQFANLLRQKYLIFYHDHGGEEIEFYALGANAYPDADVTITAVDDFSKDMDKVHRRLYVWRDETETVHSDGTATDPMHNLGFLESTASPPARHYPDSLMSVTIRPDLRLEDGDCVNLAALGSTTKMYALVTEEYIAPSKSHPAPRWHMIIDANEIFGNTAGGAMPSTIERVSNYTPLNTSMFNGILSANENNVQAAMDKLDDHTHAGGSGPTYLPLGVYANIGPLTASPSYPYSATIDRTLTLVKFTLDPYVADTNNGSNYWTLELRRLTDNSVIASFNTSGNAANTHAVMTTTSFNINPIDTDDKAIGMYCAKVGNPGAMWLSGPVLEVTEA